MPQATQKEIFYVKCHPKLTTIIDKTYFNSLYAFFLCMFIKSILEKQLSYDGKGKFLTLIVSRLIANFCLYLFPIVLNLVLIAIGLSSEL
jgi:hypothetical protein